MSRYSPEKTYKLTDFGNAERLVDTYGDRLKYVPGIGWMHYDGRKWVNDERIVERYARKTIRQLSREVQQMRDSKHRDSLGSWVKTSENYNKITAMVNSARSEPGFTATSEQFDSNIWLFNCKNGTLDLKGGELLQHSSKHFITQISDVNYHPDTEAPRWGTFLEQVIGNEEVISFVQKAVGYSLTGDTSEQCLFILIGEGANGKTTFLEALRIVLEEYGIQTSLNTFQV